MQKIRRSETGSKIAESFLVRYGLKFVVGFLVVLVFLTAVQCTVKKPESPTFTTKLSVPLVNRIYNMDEIVEKMDQPGLTIDSSGNVTFEFSEEMDTITVDDNLAVDDISNVTSEVLGQVDIDPDDPAPIQVSLSDYVSLVLDTIPPASFDIENDIPPFSTFSWAKIASGGINAQITNNFGVDLDTVIASIYTINDYIGWSDTILVSQGSFPSGIANGDIESIYMDLSGDSITSQLYMMVHCHTPGAGGILSLDDKDLTTEVGFGSGITVSSAQAEIPQTTLDLSENVNLNEDNTIQTATLSGGTLSIEIQNGSNLTADLDFQIPDFTNGGAPLSRSRTIYGSSTETILVDLTGYTFAPSNPDFVTITASAVTNPSGGQVIVSETDQFTLTSQLTNLQFSSMTGIIAPTEATINENVELDIPEGFDSLQLVNAELTMEIINGFNFPGDLNLTIDGNGGQQLIVPLTSITPGSPASPETTIIVLDDLSDFLNPVPTQITVDGAATFGDGVTSGTVTPDDFIVSNITIRSPLEFRLVGTPTFAGDTTSEEIDQDDINIVTDHVLSAVLTANITNTLPIGISVKLFLDGDSTRLNESMAQVVKEIAVDPDAVSQVTLSLSNADIQVLDNEFLCSSQEITLLGSDTPVAITGSDSLIVQAVIEADYNFDGEFDDDEDE